MSVDKLQEKIRKGKTPLMVDLSLLPEQLPPHLIAQEGRFLPAYVRFCTELMEMLRGQVPALRFSFNRFALLGEQGLTALAGLTGEAKKQGYYVLLDVPDMHTLGDGEALCHSFLSPDCLWAFDGLCMGVYCGSDSLRDVSKALRETDRDLFVLLRTPNRSASDLQDLMTGGRLVHTAVADLVSRYTGPLVGKSGYARMAGLASATAPDSLRNLRSARKELFLLVDGIDQPGANAKNCSLAFDRLGHGAIVCAGAGVLNAWKGEDSDGTDFAQWAEKAVLRLKNNIARYVTIL